MFLKFKYVLCLLCAIFFLSSAFAGPWLLPGNLSVKSDIDLLADAGLIKAPVMTWPIAWVNIGPDLLSPKAVAILRTEPNAVKQAYQRIVALYKESYQPEKLQTSTYISGGKNINPFPTFQYQPYNNFASGAAAGYQTANVAGNLDLNYYNGVGDTYSNYVHLDNSYAYAFPGNWGIGVDQFNRWWGPAYSDSMILSDNAEPMPTLTVQRMQAEAWENKWFHWVGPWSLTSSLSMNGPSDYPYPTGVDNILYWVTNFSFRPLESLQFEISRNVLFSGEQRPLNSEMFLSLFTQRDAATCGNTLCNNVPGSQEWEISGKWSLLPVFNIPEDFYLQTIFNDELPSNYQLPWPYKYFLTPPARTAFIAGTSFLNQFNQGTLRTYLEYEYNIQNLYYFWGVNESNIYGGQYPYTYYNNLLGSPLGAEGIGTTLGEIFNENDGNSDTAMIRYLRLNTENWGTTGTPGYPFSKQNVLWVSAGRTMALPHQLGSLTTQLGYLKLIEGAGLSSGVSTNLTWSKNF